MEVNEVVSLFPSEAGGGSERVGFQVVKHLVVAI